MSDLAHAERVEKHPRLKREGKTTKEESERMSHSGIANFRQLSREARKSEGLFSLVRCASARSPSPDLAFAFEDSMRSETVGWSSENELCDVKADMSLYVFCFLERSVNEMYGWRDNGDLSSGQ